MVDVSLYRHFQRTGKCLEDAFYLVMLIFAFSLDIEVHLCCITQTLEEMLEHLGWHFAHLLSVELGIPNQPWTATEIQCYLTETVVHRQTVAVSFYSALIT